MRLGFGLAAALLAVVPMSASAATPSPNVDLSVLRSALADAPSSSWQESTVGRDEMEGPFDALAYVNAGWTDQSTRDDVRNRLSYDRFIGGYGRVFYNEDLDAWMVEDVKAFPNVADASSFWQWSRDEFHWDPGAEVSTKDIPNSFGDKYRVESAFGVEVYFAKSMYVFTVTVGSSVEHLVDITQRQAALMYAFAPSDNLLPSAALPVAAHENPTMRLVQGLEIVAAAGVVVMIVAMVLLFVLGARRRQAQAVSTISPDGRYWWDGTTWQPLMRP